MQLVKLKEQLAAQASEVAALDQKSQAAEQRADAARATEAELRTQLQAQIAVHEAECASFRAEISELTAHVEDAKRVAAPSDVEIVLPVVQAETRCVCFDHLELFNFVYLFLS